MALRLTSDEERRVWHVNDGDQQVAELYLDYADQFGEVATEDYLFDKHGFGVKEIIESCKTIMEKKL